ncbi:LytTR family DNA-binding domain-containing protein [Flavobacteriaceae bacterium]|nr:LytTR family DNA-binding domain-containing protein [Flavobacteriaceae bacterium]
MNLNCIIVDAKATQRLTTLKLISTNPSLNLIGKFSSALETKKFPLLTTVDLIIMDLDLPGSRGFDLLDILNEMPNISIPYVIVVSNNESYALKAFDYNVIDYLVKPTTQTRFDEAIAKTVLQAKMSENFKDDDGEHIFVKSNLKKRKIYIKDIKWIEALGDYVKLITNNKSFVILSTMKAFENELPNGLFLRIHKSYIVNLTKVERYDSKHVEIEKIKLPLSRTRKTQLSQALEEIAH